VIFPRGPHDEIQGGLSPRLSRTGMARRSLVQRCHVEYATEEAGEGQDVTWGFHTARPKEPHASRNRAGS
jgi:hypothetical protein